MKTKYQYDFNTGLLTNQIDLNNLTTTFGYDTAWRLLTVNLPSGAVATTQFDRDGNGNDQLAYSEKVSYAENGANKVITSKVWLDGGGRELRSGGGAGSAPTGFDMVATVYDKQARVLKQSNPYSGDSSGNGTSLYWTTNSYDLLSRTTQVKLPDNQTITTTYTPAALPTEATVLVTDQVGRKRQSETDGLGRIVKVTEPDPTTGSLVWATSYSYDIVDNLTGVNQNGQTRTFVYDALSRMTSQITPEAGLMTIAYTDFNDVKKRVDARNVETHYKYDTLNRLTQVWYTGLGGDDTGSVRPALPAGVAATTDVTMSYNNFASSQPGNGQINQLTDGAGTETYTYDSLSRLSSKVRVVDGRSYQTQHLYNTVNEATTLIYQSGKRVRMNHDQRGRLSGLDRVDTAGNVLGQYVTSIGYNIASQVTNIGLASGVTEGYGYSPDRLQMNSQTVTKGANTLLSLTYGYSASAGQMGAGSLAGNSGQMVSITGSVNGQTRNQAFTYDNVGRLATATGSTWQRRYGYDRWGNRTGVWNATNGGTQIQSVAIATTASVANNRVANVNSISYSHDASGNVTNDGSHGYGYDGEGRMANVDGGATASYTYDASNWRVKKVAGGITTHCVWEGGVVIAEYNAATGALVSEYIYAGSRMVAREQGGVLRYYHQDRLSTRLITDGSGLVVGQMDQQPFGEDPLTGSGESEKHRFTNYERDSESDTDYAVNRQYQTNIGRFNRPDPVAGTISNPQSMNRYSYTQNDPVNLTDPMGLFVSAEYSRPGVYWDGFLVEGPWLNLVMNLWEGGAVDILPDGARRSRRGDRWVVDIGEDDVIDVSELNDWWRLMLVGYQRSDRDRKEDYDWARNVLKNGMPFSREPVDNIKGIGDCFNRWKFSSTIAGLVGEQYRGFAEALETGSEISVASDMLATMRKAERRGVGGSTNPYASGTNRLFRAIGKTLNLPSGVRRGLTFIGDKLTPALAIVGTLAAGYNASIFTQCLFGALE